MMSVMAGAPIGLKRGNAPGGDLQILPDHLGHEIVELGFVPPTQPLVGLGGVADQEVDLCRAEIARVDFDQDTTIGAIDASLLDAIPNPLDVDSDSAKCLFYKAAHAMSLSGRENVV